MKLQVQVILSSRLPEKTQLKKKTSSNGRLRACIVLQMLQVLRKTFLCWIISNSRRGWKTPLHVLNKQPATERKEEKCSSLMSIICMQHLGFMCTLPCFNIWCFHVETTAPHRILLVTERKCFGSFSVISCKLIHFKKWCSVYNSFLRTKTTKKILYLIRKAVSTGTRAESTLWCELTLWPQEWLQHYMLALVSNCWSNCSSLR